MSENGMETDQDKLDDLKTYRIIKDVKEVLKYAGQPDLYLLSPTFAISENTRFQPASIAD